MRETCAICTNCGTQFAPRAAPPDHCPICRDDRQYEHWEGQQWTTLAELQRNHRTIAAREAPELLGIGIEPDFGIGQRALLLRTPSGNILWDCISLVDDHALRQIRAAGGVSAIAISHPHYYASMIEWSRALDNAPIFLHTADREWVKRPDPTIIFWEGHTRQLPGGVTLVRCGGHFPGGTVCHYAGGAEGRGILLTGDIFQVCMDRRYVSFMYSYPNYIPLSVAAVEHLTAAVAPFEYERLYGAFWGRVIGADGKSAVARSSRRYIAALTGAPVQYSSVDRPPPGSVEAALSG